MRKLIAPVLIVAAVAGLSAPTTAVAGSRCETVHLTGQTQLNFANGRIEGTLTGTAGRKPFSILSSTAILEEKQRGSATFLKTTHEFTVVGGEHDGKKMTTLDNAVLVPSRTEGVSNAASHVNIVSGASGFFVGVGSIDFRTGIVATWKLIVGRVCGL
jgi:hypothetical protein